MPIDIWLLQIDSPQGANRNHSSEPYLLYYCRFAFEKNFPQFDPASTYQQLTAQPQYAKDVIAALPTNQRQALMMYHNSLKGAK